MANVMAALPNIGGALCSMPQSLADATTRVLCINAAKTRNRLKFAGLPQTRQQISAVSGPKSNILWRHVDGRYCCLISFFSGCQYVPSLRRCGPTKLCDGAKTANFWRFFASCIFSEPRAARFRPAS